MAYQLKNVKTNEVIKEGTVNKLNQHRKMMIYKLESQIESMLDNIKKHGKLNPYQKYFVKIAKQELVLCHPDTGFQMRAWNAFDGVKTKIADYAIERFNIHPILIKNFLLENTDGIYVEAYISITHDFNSTRAISEAMHTDTNLFDIRDDNLVIFESFDSKDDLVMWKLKSKFSVKDIKIIDKDYELDLLGSVEREFGIDLKVSFLGA